MNSPLCTGAEQPEIYPIMNLKTQNMETSDDTITKDSDIDIYTINWKDTEMDYDNYLNDIESFFREDFENDISEEETF
ncbi:hypothetical protein [Chryseobacterium sp.]|uniref:hypothetical protein n=1 Tax=Chryseobacterium sp. TaxID=1871047 RepID=UPI0025C5785C|nr:hypothetical protein [Chryseobacterium sp.]